MDRRVLPGLPSFGLLIRRLGVQIPRGALRRSSEIRLLAHPVDVCSQGSIFACGTFPKAETRHGELKLVRAHQIFLEQRRHEEIPIAVVVKENRHLISVISLNRALAPVLGGDAGPDREGLLPVWGRGALKVVVTVTAGTWVVLPEVGQEE